jgi:ABC-type transport system involved in cytochrome bd biosynthesis fused ATPase/permease subunit
MTERKRQVLLGGLLRRLQRRDRLLSAVLWQRASGDLLSRIVADIETLEQIAVRVLMPAAAAVLAGIFASAVLAPFDPALGLVLTAVMAWSPSACPLVAPGGPRRCAC